MQAIAIERFGGRDELALTEVRDPKVGPDSVLIESRAASVNPVDCKIREGKLDGAFDHVFPVVLGWDVAGVVRAVGPAVTEFAPGDEVYAYCRKDVIGAGTYAELVAMREWAVARKPSAISFEEAGAVPLAGLTALQLRDKLELRPGDVALVQAAAGGVGHFAVQLAKAAGAHVIGVASAAKHDFVRGLGADELIDYREQDVAEAVLAAHPNGIDAVFDLFGGDAQAAAAGCLVERRGRIASIAAPPSAAVFEQRGVETHYVFVRPSADGLRELAGLIERGAVRVHVSEAVPLAAAARAHELVEGGHARGKVALRV